MDNSLPSILEAASSILVLLPTTPTFDQVAAGLSFYLSYKDSKDMTISCPTPMLVETNRLFGVDKVGAELGNKNLSIKFQGYPAESVERVSADITGTELCLTVIPKLGQPSPKKEQVKIDYSGVGADLIVLIGGVDDSHFPDISKEELKNVKTIHMGTKGLLVSPGRNVLTFSKSASSVSEIMAIVLKQLGINFDADIATNLVAGIEEGSQKFIGHDVTADTFDIFAHLLRSGGQRTEKTKFQEKKYPPGAIPGELPNIEKVEKKEELVENPVILDQKKEESKPLIQPQDEPAPKDWFEPKIYKGNTVN